MTDAIITAAAAFLIAVLWFDLMFDVQVLPHRRSPELPEPVLASIAAYYRRVTTDASPMGRLVVLVMLALLASLIAQAANQDPDWASAVSIPAALLATGIAVTRTFWRARRLGARADPPETQSALARSTLRDHLISLTAMTVVLAAQIAVA